MKVRDLLHFALGAFVACGLVYIAADPAVMLIGVAAVAAVVVGWIAIGVMAGAEL